MNIPVWGIYNHQECEYIPGIILILDRESRATLDSDEFCPVISSLGIPGINYQKKVENKQININVRQHQLKYFFLEYFLLLISLDCSSCNYIRDFEVLLFYQFLMLPFLSEILMSCCLSHSIGMRTRENTLFDFLWKIL